MNAYRRWALVCNIFHLLVTSIAILSALALTFCLTYFFTRNAYKTTNKPNEEEEKEDVPSMCELRLPRDIMPLGYDLSVQTYLPSYVDFPHDKDYTFDADLEIKLNVLESTDKIVLNMRKLVIHENNCSLSVNGDSIDIQNIIPQEKLDKVEIVAARSLEKGKEAILKLSYSGPISTSLGGLYQTTYTEKNVTKVAAATYLEPTQARNMVPCFDEPEFKAKWKIKIKHPRGTIAISNGIEDEVKEAEGWITSKFVETPEMSSYLIALMVSEFDYIENYTDTGVRFRIWSRREAVNGTYYALYAGVKCLEYFEKLFDEEFPLKKQDMTALPDFSIGAMENWGLVTYRENRLLYDDRLYGPDSKRRIAQDVAHELAHQWFGDLVTMKWWDELWLNEGFARYIEYLGTDFISGGLMRMKEYFVLGPLTKGLARDSVSSHPLSFKIDKASQIHEAFDSISYDKGGAVLRMIAAVIGDDNFIKGVTHYLKKFKHSNTKAKDLWEAMDEVVQGIEGPYGELKLIEYAEPWVTQMGFPLVTVQYLNSTHLNITQKRYRKNPTSKDPEKYATPKYGFKWDVPIWYKEGHEDEKFAWLKRDEPLHLKINDPDSPLVINIGRFGFYRQNYDAKGWEKIETQLKNNFEIYNTTTRNGIISDAFAAALIDEVNYTTVFSILEYIEDEEELLPWEEALNGYFAILDFFGNEPEVKPAKQFMLTLMKRIYKKSSMDRIAKEYRNDTLSFEIQLQQRIIESYCLLGAHDCIAKYKKLFDEEVIEKCKGPNAETSQCVILAAPLRAKTYCYGVSEGDGTVYEKVKALYMAESVALEKDNLRRALACSKDITALKELMLTAINRNSSFVRLQDVYSVFSSVSTNPAGKEIIFEFLLERWNDIYDGLMPESDIINNIITASAAGIRTQQQIDQIKNLKKNGNHAKNFGSFDEVIEESQHKVEWIAKHFQSLAEFFKQRVKAAEFLKN